jgi:hypothetical protein
VTAQVTYLVICVIPVRVTLPRANSEKGALK